MPTPNQLPGRPSSYTDAATAYLNADAKTAWSTQSRSPSQTSLSSSAKVIGVASYIHSGPAAQISPCHTDVIAPETAGCHTLYQQFLDQGAAICPMDSMAHAAHQRLPSGYGTKLSSPDGGQAWSRDSGRLLKNFGAQDGGQDPRSLHFMNKDGVHFPEDRLVAALKTDWSRVASEDDPQRECTERLGAAVSDIEQSAADRQTVAELDTPLDVQVSACFVLEKCCWPAQDLMAECYPRTHAPAGRAADSDTLLMLKRSRSTVPCSSNVFESAIVDMSPDALWQSIRSMDLSFTQEIVGGELRSGNSVTEVGSLHKLFFRDGSEWLVQIAELSDHERTLVLDLLERSDGVRVSSCVHSIRLGRVTQTDSTYVEWNVDYSNDADAQICQDARYKVKDYLTGMQQYFRR